jgi:hypothetical protein
MFILAAIEGALGMTKNHQDMWQGIKALSERHLSRSTNTGYFAT